MTSSHPLRRLGADGALLFAVRACRMASYGALSIVLLPYLAAIPLDSGAIGALLSCILVGDLVISLFLTSRADRFGRRRTLVIGAVLKLISGVVFAATGNWWALALAGTVGVISVAGGEIGPFLAVEQAALADLVADTQPPDAAAILTTVFGWQNALGYIAQAAGAVAGGFIVEWRKLTGSSEIDALRGVLWLYAAFGAAKAVLYLCLSSRVEIRPKATAKTSIASGGVAQPSPLALSGRARGPGCFRNVLHCGLVSKESRATVAQLCVLFCIDSFAGGFVMQSALAMYFLVRWGVGGEALGFTLSASNIVAGCSSVAAGYFVKRWGAINTMVFTHLPSNLLLMAIPLMPSASLAIAMTVARFSISQMDVPARQAYVASVVAPEERSAAGGITNVVRSLGLVCSQLPLAFLLSAPPSSPLFIAPFFIAGCLKCTYDIALYCSFQRFQQHKQQQEKLRLDALGGAVVASGKVSAETSDDNDVDDVVLSLMPASKLAVASTQRDAKLPPPPPSLSSTAISLAAAAAIYSGEDEDGEETSLLSESAVPSIPDATTHDGLCVPGDSYRDAEGAAAAEPASMVDASPLPSSALFLAAPTASSSPASASDPPALHNNGGGTLSQAALGNGVEQQRPTVLSSTPVVVERDSGSPLNRSSDRVLQSRVSRATEPSTRRNVVKPAPRKDAVTMIGDVDSYA